MIFEPAATSGYLDDLDGAVRAAEEGRFATDKRQPLELHALDRLKEVLVTSFTLGFASPGIRLSLSLSGAAPPSEYRPWWSLPEAVRARCKARGTAEVGAKPPLRNCMQAPVVNGEPARWR